jgi:hypothetical protein
MRKVGKRAVVKHLNYQGLDLAIEFQKGGKRPYKDEAGKEHFKTMRADYGEVRGTEGMDGDPVDVYVGPDKDSGLVFIVTQMKRGDWDKVDEEKCILGVRTAKQARDLYLAHYNDDRFCGLIKELTFEQFLERLSTRGLEGQKLSKLHAIARHAHKLKHVRGIEQSAIKETTMNQVNKRLAAMEEATGEKISSAAGRIAEINYLRMQQGASVLHAGDHGVKVASPGRRRAHVEPDLVDAFLKSAGSKNDPDPQWDNEIANDVQALLKKKAPHSLEDKRRSAIAKSELVRHEQIGIGIPKQNIRENPKDSKMRKAAALAHVNLFLKEASAATKKADEPSAAQEKLAERKHLRDRVLVLGGGAAGAVGAHEAAKRYGHKLLGYAPNQAQLGSALVLGGMGGAQLTRAALRDHYKSAALSDRASRISDRIDDVGIGVLASPYIAEGLSKALKGKSGRLGRAGAALHAYHDNFGKKNRKEIAGLALVAPGVTHTLAKGVDKALDRHKKASLLKTALLGAAVAGIAAKASPGLLRRGVAAAGKAVGSGVGTGLMLGGAGVGAGLYGAKKLLTGHRTEGLSAPSYQPPRMF